MKEHERCVVRIDTTDRYDQKLLCPVCKFEYVHIRQVAVLQEDKLTVVANNCTHVKDAKNSGRGSEVAITFSCENGHDFEYVLRFHEGCTSISLRSESRASAEDGCLVHENPDKPDTELWRN